MPDCAKFYQNWSNGLWDTVFFDFSRWRLPPCWILKFLIFYWLTGPGGLRCITIQISSKSVTSLWRYSDFTIFQYDYSWPFGPQDYAPHLTHTPVLMVRNFGQCFTRWWSMRPQVCILHESSCSLRFIWYWREFKHLMVQNVRFSKFFLGGESGEAPAPPQVMVIKLKIKEMYFKNVDQWVHALYKKILNTYTLLKLKDCTSLLQFCTWWSCML